jgi:hypothetical protein
MMDDLIVVVEFMLMVWVLRWWRLRWWRMQIVHFEID